MGRKMKGSNRVTAILICVNNIKVRIPLDSEEKIQSKEKSLMIVKHLSKEYKRIKDKKYSLNQTALCPSNNFYNINTNNNQNNNNFGLINSYNNKAQVQNEGELFNMIPMKEQIPQKSKINFLLNTYENTPKAQLNYLNSQFEDQEFRHDGESEKIIAEWDRLWGDGSANELNEEKEFFCPNLNPILV